MDSQGSSEKRQIIRHGLGFYRALILTGLYTQRNGNSSFDPTNFEHFIPALKHCIAVHPILSATIQGEDTEDPSFARPETINLRNHIQILDSADDTGPQEDDLDFITEITKKAHDQPLLGVDKQPPWRIVVLPLANGGATLTEKRMYIIFAYSHSHGDGKSGLAFHRTFLEGLNLENPQHGSTYVYQPPASSLPPPLEEACHLRISWPFLLLNILGSIVPTVAHKLFGFQPSGADNVWSGRAMCHDSLNFQTGSQSLLVKSDKVHSILKVCREHGTKFTGIFNQLVVSALDHALAGDPTTRSFLGGIVLDLRALIPLYSDDQMGNFVSAHYEPSDPSELVSLRNARGNLKQNAAFWNAARGTTERLANCSTTLSDQPIGLLRYISKFRPWMLGQLGKKRDFSYEISNLVVFDPQPRGLSANPPASAECKKWTVDRLIFSQPANAIGSALNFQIVTMKNGDMIITLNWQQGVLGVSDEDSFARGILGEINTEIDGLSSE